MREDVVRAYVESQLEQLTGADKIVPDQDGDYPIRFRDSGYFVRVVRDPDPIVQVFSVAVDQIECSHGLLVELNDLNTRIGFARVFWVRDQVLFETELLGQALEPVSFETACATVGGLSVRHRDRLIQEHGGRPHPHFERPPAVGDDTPIGLYL